MTNVTGEGECSSKTSGKVRTRHLSQEETSKKIRGDQSLLSDSQGKRRLRLPVEKKQKDQVRPVGQEY